MEPIELLMMRVVGVCERLKLPYYVTGSYASMTWGEPRFTQDVDMVVELPTWKVREFCEVFPDPEYYVSIEAALNAARNPGQFNILWASQGVKADIMVFSDTPFNESRLARAKKVEVPELGPIMIAAPEDIILKKLEYYREGGSDKHLRDIASVFRVSGQLLDLPYIETWVTRLNLRDQWKMIKQSVGLP